ncbi:tail fiber protein [Clostridium sp. 'deep sea']|uniref:phage tail protein n=1 Tax=Clostridium sp. 'deep sea' TaxID=2779445 RepID=UPI001896812C|nr:phage tail protein [Clostridium sp. 'deep sea']QOR36845.1 tail fiber protein [Clostridium sp. 'deep sea']
MNQLMGEIKLFAYDEVPEGWLKCEGQALHISKYPKLYMLIGTKFGKEGEHFFRLPNLLDKSSEGLIYCIATEGQLPNFKAV